MMDIFGGLGQVMKLFNSGQSPDSILEVLGSKDPELMKSYKSARDTDGFSMESFVRAEFQRRGVDINDALAMFKNFGR